MVYAVLSSKAPRECIDSLAALGFTTLLLPPFERLSSPVDTHADMLFFSYKDHIVTHREYRRSAKSVFDTLENSCNKRIIPTDDMIGDRYPQDVAFNAIALGRTLYSLTKSTSVAITGIAMKEGLETVSVTQGYAACSTLALCDTHVITADKALAKKYKENGVSVTLISSGAISLCPYDYGFIGGTSGVFEDTVYFAGDIDTHPDAKSIRAAISAHGMRVVSLTDGELCDIGGIKFFKD